MVGTLYRKRSQNVGDKTYYFITLKDRYVKGGKMCISFYSMICDLTKKGFDVLAEGQSLFIEGHFFTKVKGGAYFAAEDIRVVNDYPKTIESMILEEAKKERLQKYKVVSKINKEERAIPLKNYEKANLDDK